MKHYNEMEDLLFLPMGGGGVCEVYGIQQYFSYISARSFIGRGNQSTRRKPPNCHKSLTNFIT